MNNSLEDAQKDATSKAQHHRCLVIESGAHLARAFEQVAINPREARRCWQKYDSIVSGARADRYALSEAEILQEARLSAEQNQWLRLDIVVGCAIEKGASQAEAEIKTLTDAARKKLGEKFDKDLKSFQKPEGRAYPKKADLIPVHYIS